MDDGAQGCLFDINIISSSQFLYHELKLYLRISLIQERTSSLLSWDTLAVGSPLTKLITTGVTSYTKKEIIMKTTSSTWQWNPSLIYLSCDFHMRWNHHVIKGCVLKAVLSTDPHELKALRAELGWSILLTTCLLSTGKALSVRLFPQMINH